MDLTFGLFPWMDAGFDWRLAASLVGAALLGVCMLRYRARFLAIQEEHASTLELIANLSEGIYRSTPDGRQLAANPALVRLNGYNSEAELLAAVRDIASEWYVEPNRREEFCAALERDGKVEDFVSEVYRHKNRERIWISECARIVRSKSTGKTLFYEGSVREITETIKRLNLEEQFQKLTRQLPGGLFQLVRKPGGEFSVAYLSSGFRGLVGIPDEVHYKDPQFFIRHIHPDDRKAYFQTMRESGETLSPWNLEMRIHTVTGEEKWLRLTATPEAQDGTIIWHGYMADISLRKKHEMAIEELAYYDPLTHLPNRRMLTDRLTQALAACARRKDRGVLLFIDLDNFKALNDTHGHDVGDAFLMQVAARLKESLRKNDIVARIGGDEFVVVAEESGYDHATAVARGITIGNQVLAAFRAGFDLGGTMHSGSASIGVVVFDGSEAGVDDILKRADMAMYQAKAAGRDGVALFDPNEAARGWVATTAEPADDAVTQPENAEERRWGRRLTA